MHLFGPVYCPTCPGSQGGSVVVGTADVLPSAEVDTNRCSYSLVRVDPARFAVAVPDDSELLARLTAALAAQHAPTISIDRTPTAVLSFACETWEPMLRSRVVQALEVAFGPDWQDVVRALD
jgi:hypothetical protein